VTSQISSHAALVHHQFSTHQYVGNSDRKTMWVECIGSVSNALRIENSSNVAQLVQQTIMRAMGQKLDAAILEGFGSGAEPTGILNTSGINTVTSVGTPTNYAEMTTAVKELLVDNYSGDISGLAWIAHPRDYATYDGLVGTTNQSLRPTSMGRRPETVFDYRAADQWRS